MADNAIPSIGGVAPVGDSDAGRAAHGPADASSVKFDAALSQAEGKVETKPKDPAAEAALQTATNNILHSNVRLHFRVDPKTHEVTVLMVDQKSKRVVRSIPPEEIGKLKEGDLVELFA